MVTVVNYAVKDNSEGKSFVMLQLQGDLEFVQSAGSGKFYATARKCAITSTFDERTAAMLIGKQIPGSIIKETCDSYEYVIPETGEQVMLTHRYTYSPVEQIVQPQKVTQVPVQQPMNFLGGMNTVPMAEA